ncbi:MAG TPA: prepilin-type N-terminal cleavage/methylation domain-containing protein [Chromatiales bacterium]|nr:prepilin-type N-terminal cleavage/methylation domain-containing protein [Chromatiales bacterium]
MRKARFRNSNASCGFTLIELMIVFAIIGIIAAIAYPSYQEYINRTRRADGKAEMMNVAQLLERCFTRSGRYNGCDIDKDGTVDSADGSITFTSDSGFYTLTVTPTATAFTISAAPQGAHASDACGNLTLNDQGTRGVTGSKPVAECW